MINTVPISELQDVFAHKVFILRLVKLYNPKKASKKLKDFITLAAVEFKWKYKSYGVERKIKNKIKL